MVSRRKQIRPSMSNEKKHNENVVTNLTKLLVVTTVFMSVILYNSWNKSSKNEPEYVEHKLIEFYQDSCHLNPKIGFKTVNGLRGAYTKENLKENEKILFGDQACTICTERALNDYPVIHFFLEAISNSILIDREEDKYIPSLAIWLLLTPSDHPYIRSLPTLEDLSTHLPVFWPDGFSRQFPEWFTGGWVERKFLREKSQFASFTTILIHKILHIWKDTDMPPVTFEDVKWAITIVWTRSVDVHGETCLLPIFDQLNHQHGDTANVQWHTFAQDDEFRYKMTTSKPVTKGDTLWLHYGKLNNRELLAQYGFAINDVPQIYKTEIEFDGIKRTCSELNNEVKCLKIFESEWPFYNASRGIQMPLKLQQGRLNIAYKSFFEVYEKTFQRSAEILLISAMKNMLLEETPSFSELDGSKRAMAEMVVAERRTILKTLIADRISHLKNLVGSLS